MFLVTGELADDVTTNAEKAVRTYTTFSSLLSQSNKNHWLKTQTTGWLSCRDDIWSDHLGGWRRAGRGK